MCIPAPANTRIPPRKSVRKRSLLCRNEQHRLSAWTISLILKNCPALLINRQFASHFIQQNALRYTRYAVTPAPQPEANLHLTTAALRAATILAATTLSTSLGASAQANSSATPAPASEADRLRGEYGPYRANNDLLYYHLGVRVDPEHQTLGGKNVIRFRMLEPGTRIQLDL